MCSPETIEHCESLRLVASPVELTKVRRRLIRALLKDWTCRYCGWHHLGVWRAVVCDCCGNDVRKWAKNNGTPLV
jgi:hypothetical protein